MPNHEFRTLFMANTQKNYFTEIQDVFKIDCIMFDLSEIFVKHFFSMQAFHIESSFIFSMNAFKVNSFHFCAALLEYKSS